MVGCWDVRVLGYWDVVMLDFGSGVVANCWQLLKEQLLLLLRSGWMWMRWCPAVAHCSTAAREGIRMLVASRDWIGFGNGRGWRRPLAEAT